MNDMADVLGELWDAGNCTGLDGWIGPGRGAGEVDDYALTTRERDVAKALAALSTAGFGPVNEARAGALEDAAKECDRTSSNITNNNQSLTPAWDGMAEGWKNAATRLRARAAAERGGE